MGKEMKAPRSVIATTSDNTKNRTKVSALFNKRMKDHWTKLPATFLANFQPRKIPFFKAYISRTGPK